MSAPSMVGLVLAAGALERLASAGMPKALLPFQDKTFLQTTIDALVGNVEKILVVLGHEAEQIQKVIPSGVEVVIHTQYRDGQTSSLQSGIRHIQVKGWPCDAVVVSLVDHPGVSSGLVRQLTKYFAQMNARIVVPAYQGMKGHPIVMSSSLFSDVLALPHDQGANVIMRKYAQEVCELSTTETAVLRNINTPDQLEPEWRGPERGSTAGERGPSRTDQKIES